VGGFQSRASGPVARDAALLEWAEHLCVEAPADRRVWSSLSLFLTLWEASPSPEAGAPARVAVGHVVLSLAEALLYARRGNPDMQTTRDGGAEMSTPLDGTLLGGKARPRLASARGCPAARRAPRASWAAASEP
jgi:hypothetical protein